jgi:DNA-binding LacI/PurR family transcriptional regulator
MAAPTIYDIAERAGVGIATVSRVINGSRRVAEVTRNRVQAAMNELGFRPNAAARRLAVRAPNRPRIAALMPFFTSAFYFNVCKALSAELTSAGVDFLLVDVRDDSDTDRHLDRLLTERSCEGVVVCSMHVSEERRLLLAAAGIPAVTIDADIPEVPNICVDNVEGGRMLSRTLSERGAVKQVLLLGNREARVFRDREQGFLEVCPPGSQVIETDSLDVDHGEDIVRHVLAEHPEIDGIACSCDTLAVGVVQGLKTIGRKVPSEIQVIGFDDQPMMDVLGLTTVRQPMQEFGTWAARTLLAQISDREAAAESTVLPLELVRRQTTR